MQTLSAQTNQGQWLMGGSVSFTNQSVSGSSGSSSTFQISPSVGYFLRDNWAVGTFFSYENQSSSGSSGSESQLDISSFTRYYFTNIGNNAKLLGEFSFGFGSQSSGSSSSISLTKWGFSAGPAFFLNKNVALETLLFFNSTTYKGSSNAQNAFGIDIGLQIHL